MSSLFKALKNLGKTTQKVQNIQPPQIVNNNCQSQANMATQVILNNGIKMPRIGRKYKTLNFLIPIISLLWLTNHFKPVLS